MKRLTKNGDSLPYFAAKASIWVVSLLTLTTITVADLVFEGKSGISGMFAVVPALAVVQNADRRRFHLIGGVTVATCVALAAFQWRGDVLASAAGVTVVMVVCGTGCLTHLRRLAETQAVAEAVQRALLRPLPSRLGPLRLETRYLASAPQAKVGGDVYDAAWTPYGIRLMIGDVMGNGLGAVETAGRLLGTFREAAYEEGDLDSLAWRLHVGLCRSPSVGEFEVFATALLISISPGETSPRCCRAAIRRRCSCRPRAERRRSRSVRPCRLSGCWSSATSTARSRSACGRAMACCSTPTDSPRPATRAESSSRWPSAPRVPRRRTWSSAWSTTWPRTRAPVSPTTPPWF